MENEVDNNYISRAIDELVATLGVKEQVVAKNFDKPFGLGGDAKKCIKGIAGYLGLPIEINLSYISKNYKPNAQDNFQSHYIVKTDWTGRGTQGITAQVSIPSNLPLYGSDSLKNFPINVRISENCKDSPKTFIAVMAHELSHIVLYSLWHKEKENEFYTDLTAMILGFSKVMGSGRRVMKVKSGFGYTEYQTTTYGYLSDDNFDFAKKKINQIVDSRKNEKEKILPKVHELRKSYTIFERRLRNVREFLKQIDKKPKQNMAREDVPPIMLMHQPNYFYDYETALSFHQDKLTKIEFFLKNLTHFSEASLKRLKETGYEIQSLHSSLADQVRKITRDSDVLKKYVGFWAKLRASLS